MSYYDNSVIEKIRNKGDIVSIIGEFLPLKKRGRNFLALCPFHGEKTPSFVVSPEKQIYYCFGCGASGDVFSFLMEYEGLTFSEAIVCLGKKLGINTEKAKVAGKGKHVTDEEREKIERLYTIHAFVARYFYRKFYSELGRKAFYYTQKRGLLKETLKTFKVGYAPYHSDELVEQLIKLHYTEEELLLSGILGKNNTGRIYCKFYNRLIFPIENSQGKIIAFGGRSIGNNEPKYLNSQETPIFKKKNNLFALKHALPAIKKQNQVLLMEGYMDVISVWQNGVKNSVASLGTGFTEEQGRLLLRYCNEIVVVYDSDDAGIKAALKAIDILKPLEVEVKIATLVGAKDPDDYIREFGLNVFLERIRLAKSGFRYLLDYNKERFDCKIPEEKVKCVRQLLSYVMSFEDELLRNEYLNILAKELAMDKTELQSIVFGKKLTPSKSNHYRKNRTNEKQKKIEAEEPLDKSQLAAVKLFTNHLQFAHLFNEEILVAFTNERIRALLDYILALPSEERRLDIILAKLHSDLDMKSILAALTMESEDDFPVMEEKDFECYLLAVRKNYLKVLLNKIIVKMKLVEKEGNKSLLNELQKEGIFYIKKITQIEKTQKGVL